MPNSPTTAPNTVRTIVGAFVAVMLSLGAFALFEAMHWPAVYYAQWIVFYGVMIATNYPAMRGKLIQLISICLAAALLSAWLATAVMHS